IVLEPGRPFRIAEYTLSLELSATLPEVDLPALEEVPEAPTGLPDPSWLEQLQVFQRHLFRLEEPRPVLQRLAQEFQRILVPHLLAIGVSRPEGYAWDLVLCAEADSASSFDLEEADRRITEESVSSVQAWLPGQGGEAVEA